MTDPDTRMDQGLPTPDQSANAPTQTAPETTPLADESLTDHDPAALITERDQWKDKAYRLAAEMENLQRRTKQDLDNTRNFALQGFARDLLPVADNLARALESSTEATPLSQGVTMVAASLQQTLEKHGIKAVAATAGEAFDPERHEVMAQVPSHHPENHIEACLQSGFILNGRLLRPAFVTVSNGQPPAETIN